MNTFELTASAGGIDAKDTCLSEILGTRRSSVSISQSEDSSILTIVKSFIRLEPLKAVNIDSQVIGLLHCAVFSDQVVFVLAYWAPR
jgi:hypothetical protein